MKAIAAIAAVVSVGSAASAWGLWGGAAVMARSAAAAKDDATAVVSPGAFCVGAFSKNDCSGYIEPGNYEALSCDTNDCKSIRVTDAVYKAELKKSGLPCGGTCADGKCDEFRDGTLVLKFDYVLRADSCCPYRGSWAGRWEYTTVGGLVYAGEAHGTLGVGTNRDSECAVTHDACEKCYDVDLSSDIWLIGWEGSFRGVSQVSTGFFPNELNFTCDGTWLVDASPRDPFKYGIRTTNRLDGVSVNYCN